MSQAKINFFAYKLLPPDPSSKQCTFDTITTILLLRQPHRHPLDRHSLDTEAFTPRGMFESLTIRSVNKQMYDSRTNTEVWCETCVDTLQFYFDLHIPGRQHSTNLIPARNACSQHWSRASGQRRLLDCTTLVFFIWGCKQTKKIFISRTFGSYLYWGVFMCAEWLSSDVSDYSFHTKPYGSNRCSRSHDSTLDHLVVSKCRLLSFSFFNK